uniref:Myosin phosphatase Rho-interacting protein-like n=1 Tax=Gouania willdenowi TaxID=441366 RepID=A0A8C5GRX5_GOUWI
MSLKDNSCRKFQANIFNKSKCQNCFKPRESHLLNDEDLNQAKPIYGGWLLLAPEGTNFDNPLQRSRKWQRRFFILYEHGLLRYALDEMPSTLPQGTINMNQCSDVIDGESRTGQKNSLCILTPEKEHFIRSLCDHTSLCAHSSTHSLLLTHPFPQEPGPAKVTVTSSGGSIPCLPSSIASAERVPMTRASIWQEESRWSRATIPCSRSASCLSQMNQSQSDGAMPAWEEHDNDGGSGNSVSGGGRVGRSGREYAALSDVPRARSSFVSSRRSQVIGRFEDGQNVERMDTSNSNEPSANSSLREGRSERRYLTSKHVRQDRVVPDVSSSSFTNLRRAKSLDRRVTESSMPPDLLNFKKGWMTKLYDDGMWKKHWFVLTDQSLRYYKDSIAEEASELDGEVDLSTCYDVKEFPVQRNYGFQILCKDGACTLSAMTSGIRRNWIQAITKNVRTTIAPDVTRSLHDETQKDHVLLEPCPQITPEQTNKRPSGNNEPPPEPRKSRVRERRREGRSKTYDWTEFKKEQTQKPVKERADTPLTPEGRDQGKMEVDQPTSICPESEDKNKSCHVREEIEQRWHQVETTPLREEKQVPISTTFTNSSDSDKLPPHELTALLDKELGQKQKELDRLQKQNNLLKEQLENALGREQSAREGYVLQATCERGFAAMEETHQKLIEDLQRQHQREISKLMEERERLLAEETAATIAAIEAMKNAHKEELEKTQRSQVSGLNSDIDELRLQYEEELRSIQRELEVLSEQYSQKCLENAHLAQALEAERQALRQCQRENQELNSHNQELNNRLTVEITRMRSCFSGESALSPLTQGKDIYELEVLLRIKESEIQYLKQEIHSLKDELQSALRDKKYATEKYKDIYTELSIVKAKADCDITKLKEKLLLATEALGEGTVDGTVTSGYDIMKSKSNPDFMKKEQSSASKAGRGLRSKVSFSFYLSLEVSSLCSTVGAYIPGGSTRKKSDTPPPW